VSESAIAYARIIKYWQILKIKYMTFNINGLFVGEVQPSTTVAGCIEIFENIWPDPKNTIQNIESLCRDSDSDVSWSAAETIGHGAYQNIRTNKSISLTHLASVTDNKILQNVNNQFYTLLLATVNSYAKRFSIQEQFWHEGYHILKYQEGQSYQLHYDGSSNVVRTISAICYLNSDYEGGELEFPNFKIKIKPQAGMLILFPSNFAYSHIAHPVTKGTKYALVTWIRDQEIK
jgi:hypothetical protein